MQRPRIPGAGLVLAAMLGVMGCSDRDASTGRTHAVPPPGSQPEPQAAAFSLRAPTLNSSQSVQNTGPEVRVEDYPWQIALKITYRGGWRCGGVLISPNYILTAAHCLDAADADPAHHIPIGFNDFSVYFGGEVFGEGQSLAVDRTWPLAFHPNWKSDGQPLAAWDAVLLKLAQPLTAATPAPLRSVTYTSGDAVVSGWGDFDRTNQPSARLRAVKLPVVTNAVCRTKLSAVDASRLGEFTLCAVSRSDDACARDSGGPLVIGSGLRPQTVGIVSWGPVHDCGVPGPGGDLVGAYTRASAIAGWVASKTGDPSTVTSRVAEATFDVRPRTSLATRDAGSGGDVTR